MVSELEMLIGNDYKKLDKYNYDIRGDIEKSLLRIMKETYLDENSTKEIYKTIINYNGTSGLKIAHWLECAALVSRNKDAVINMSRILSLDEIVKTVGKYGEETASEIAEWIGSAAFHFRDKNKMLRACRLIDIGEREFTRHIESNGLENVLNEGLDRLVKDKSTLNAVLTYNLSKNELPKPNESNIDNYGSVVMSYLNDKYGVKKPLNLSQTVLFYSISSEKRNEMTNYINSSEEKNPIFYSMNGINDDNDRIRYSKEELKKYSVISVIGSRNKETEAGARRIVKELVGEKTVNRGKSAFYSTYRAKLPEIIGLVKNRDYGKAYEVLSNLNNENISDVLNSSNYRDYGSIGNGVIRAVESKNPLDYNKNIQMACVYLPGAAEEGISEYCRDDNVILVKYEIGGESLGSAICYKEDDKFLVDSVEGHRRFRKTKIYDIVYEDLLMRAKEYGAKEVLFGLDALNETPTDFNKHLSGKHLSKIKVKMALNTEAYLETDTKSMAYSVMI
jgi:hypothetical protein